MTYTAYRFKSIRFEDGIVVSRIAEPVVAISAESAIADIQDAYGQRVISWRLYDV